MDRVLSLLLFAAFFYVMMRFGCGAHTHGNHRGHKREGQHKEGEGSATQ